MNFEIKELKYSDIEEFYKVNTKCFVETYQNILPHDYLLKLDQDIKKYIEEEKRNFKNNQYLCYLLFYENKIVGNITIGKSRVKKYQNAGEIYSLYLLSSVQKKGLGKILLQFGIDKLKKQYNEIIICCLEKNTKANLFYQHMNFKLVGQKKCLMGDYKYLENIYYYKFS